MSVVVLIIILFKPFGLFGTQFVEIKIQHVNIFNNNWVQSKYKRQ